MKRSYNLCGMGTQTVYYYQKNYVFFLSDSFILGKKGYLLTVPKETEFPKSFFGGQFIRIVFHIITSVLHCK